jgi:hypothetical protein
MFSTGKKTYQLLLHHSTIPLSLDGLMIHWYNH